MSMLDDVLDNGLIIDWEGQPDYATGRVKIQVKSLFLGLIGPDQNITDVHSPEFVASKWQDDLRHQLRRKVEEL